MRKWAYVSVVMIGLAAGTLSATEPEAKLPEAIRYMEESRSAEETYVPNLTMKELEDRLDEAIVQLSHTRQVHSLAGGHYLVNGFVLARFRHALDGLLP